MWSLSADPRPRPGPSDRAIGSKGLAEIPYNVIVGHLRGLPSLAFTSADMNLRLSESTSYHKSLISRFESIGGHKATEM